MVEFSVGVDGQNGSLVTINKIPTSYDMARTKADPTSYDMAPAYRLFEALPLPVNFDVSTMNCLGS